MAKLALSKREDAIFASEFTIYSSYTPDLAEVTTATSSSAVSSGSRYDKMKCVSSKWMTGDEQ